MGAMEWIWHGTDLGARMTRGALAPVAGLYRVAVAGRNALYDRGVLRARESSLPTVSIGNISVGGAGKTPVSSWIAAELARRGARPAIVMRGYGEDEPLVHSTLQPSIPVIVDADRVRGVERARLAGCDTAVLDDAFQHRRISRRADVVLLSAEDFEERPRLLPAGPWREPATALRRSSLIVVTRKSAGVSAADAIQRRVAALAPGTPVALVALELDGVRRTDDAADSALSILSGARVLAVAAIGSPGAFATQLRSCGARVELMAFRDHHRFSERDLLRMRAEATSFDFVVCTLKDAVKLGPQWPRNGPPLWYVSQRVTIEAGATDVSNLLQAILDARRR